MPFTLSHPAAAVPFAQWGLVLSALVVGSMSPDFLYFLGLSTRYQFGHSLLGVLLFDIPASLIVLWLFHHILKRPLVSLFPISHQQCLIPFIQEFSFTPFWRFLKIMLSIALGALTHIVWDAFTHQSGWVVLQLPVLAMPIVETSQTSIKLYKLLQHGSTFLGAMLLLYWYLKWLKRAPSLPLKSLTLLSLQTRRLIIFSIGFSSSLLAIIYGFFRVELFTSLKSFYPFIVVTTVTGITIFFVELIIFSMIWHFKMRTTRKVTTRE